MRNAAAGTILCVIVALAGAPRSASAQVPADLVGGWIVTSWTSADGTTNAQPQRGLFIFAPTGQYSIMYVPGTEPRAGYEGEAMTDAETLAAYASIIANSGRFTVAGDTITYDAFVAKDPNYMADFNVQTRENARKLAFAIRDGILTLKWINPDGTVGQSATLRRPSAQAQGGQP